MPEARMTQAKAFDMQSQKKKFTKLYFRTSYQSSCPKTGACFARSRSSDSQSLTSLAID